MEDVKNRQWGEKEENEKENRIRERKTVGRKVRK